MKDFLLLKLASSKLMKGVVTKIIEKKIIEKFGYKIDLTLNDIQIEILADGDVTAHLDIDAKMVSTEFEKMIKELG